MTKEIFFVGIHEKKDMENFLVAPECLIQVPVNERTYSKDVYDFLKTRLPADKESEEAFAVYMDLVGHVNPHKRFFDQQFYEPEPGIKVFAQFNVKSIK